MVHGSKSSGHKSTSTASSPKLGCTWTHSRTRSEVSPRDARSIHGSPALTSCPLLFPASHRPDWASSLAIASPMLERRSITSCGNLQRGFSTLLLISISDRGIRLSRHFRSSTTPTRNLSKTTVLIVLRSAKFPHMRLRNSKGCNLIMLDMNRCCGSKHS